MSVNRKSGRKAPCKQRPARVSRKRPASRRVTQATIADKTGVSQTTVSLILGNKADGSISEDCRRRVMEVARELNYSRSRSIATNNIGVLMSYTRGPDAFARDPFYNRFFVGMMSRAQAHGYHILLEACAAGSPLPGIVDRNKIDGVVITEPMPASMLQAIRRRAPVVLANCEAGHKGITSVMPDNHGGVREAVRLLHEKGHRRIAFVGNGIVPEHAHIWERFEGYLSGMSVVGEKVREEYVFGRTMIEHHNPDDPWPGELAADFFSSLPEPPTAVIGQGDAILFPFMRRMQKHKLRIPRDCSVIGFDNLVAAELSEPPLTSIDPPMEHLGSVAVAELLQCISGSAYICKELRLPTRIVMRASVCRPRSHGEK